MKGVEVDGEHLYVRRKDPKRSLRRYSRELLVCPAINPDGGVHLSVAVEPPGEAPIGAAGLSLSPKQARRVIRHMREILAVSEEQ